VRSARALRCARPLRASAVRCASICMRHMACDVALVARIYTRFLRFSNRSGNRRPRARRASMSRRRLVCHLRSRTELVANGRSRGGRGAEGLGLLIMSGITIQQHCGVSGFAHRRAGRRAFSIICHPSLLGCLLTCRLARLLALLSRFPSRSMKGHKTKQKLENQQRRRVRCVRCKAICLPYTSRRQPFFLGWPGVPACLI
jgi:hypothetical protein